MLEGNLHGLCTACGQVAKCECGDFIAEGQEHTCLPDLL